jgi:hypothetical protein
MSVLSWVIFAVRTGKLGHFSSARLSVAWEDLLQFLSSDERSSSPSLVRLSVVLFEVIGRDPEFWPAGDVNGDNEDDVDEFAAYLRTAGGQL